MAFASKFKNIDVQRLLLVGFYGAVGVVFLVLLPFAGFPPHIGLTGILYLVTAYSVFKSRFWALWLVVALFAVATTISFYTLYVIAFTNWVVGIGMVAYAVLTWVFTLYFALKRKPSGS